MLPIETAEYKPLATINIDNMTLQVPASINTRFGFAQGLLTDRYGTRLANDTAANVQLRVGAIFDSKLGLAPINLHIEYEHDLVTGVVTGGPTRVVPAGQMDSSIDGIGLPNGEGTDTQLRKLFARAALGYNLQASAGVQTSHWGLGLLANDGTYGWEPGNARFTDPRGGDRLVAEEVDVRLAVPPVDPIEVRLRGRVAELDIRWEAVCLDDFAQRASPDEAAGAHFAIARRGLFAPQFVG